MILKKLNQEALAEMEYFFSGDELTLTAVSGNQKTVYVAIENKIGCAMCSFNIDRCTLNLTRRKCSALQRLDKQQIAWVKNGK